MEDKSMDPRLAKLETAVDFMQRDIKELKEDVRAVKSDINHIRTTDFAAAVRRHHCRRIRARRPDVQRFSLALTRPLPIKIPVPDQADFSSESFRCCFICDSSSISVPLSSPDTSLSSSAIQPSCTTAISAKARRPAGVSITL